MINVLVDYDISDKLWIYINAKNGENKLQQILLIKFNKSKTELNLKINWEHWMIKLINFCVNFITGKLE
jgi:hypothetical protein